MPATSAKQARFARMCEHADHPPSGCPKRGTLRHFQHTAKQRPRKGAILHGKGVLAALLLTPSLAWAQAVIPGTPTSSQETITVATTAVGVTADTCKTNNTDGVLIQVLTGAVYVSLHGATATPDSGDFALGVGDYLFVRPASKLRMIQQSASSTVKAQCVE